MQIFLKYKNMVTWFTWSTGRWIAKSNLKLNLTFRDYDPVGILACRDFDPVGILTCRDFDPVGILNLSGFWISGFWVSGFWPVGILSFDWCLDVQLIIPMDWTWAGTDSPVDWKNQVTTLNTDCTVFLCDNYIFNSPQ